MPTLAHDFLLLALDDNTGKSLLEDEFILKSSIAAAWIGEMMFRDRLVATSANQFALRPGPTSDGLLGKVEEALVDSKPATLRQCMDKLWGSWGGRDLVGWLTEDLVNRGVLRQEADKFLFITYNRRNPARDMASELATLERLRRHLKTVTTEDPPCRDDALISLLRAANLLSHVWTEAELETHRETLLERTKRAPLGRESKQAADESRAAMIVATTVAIT